MDEFAKMIYEYWRSNNENNIDWGNYLEAIENIHNYLTCPDVDGALVGGASLKVESFKALVENI